MKIIVVPHDPDWNRKFETEAAVVSAALGSAASAIHHIGSTSISSILAKPIIDMLVEASSLEAVDQNTQAMDSAGYEAKGEFGIPGRRYFRKDNALGEREYHVHAFRRGSSGAIRHLAFRDYLRAYPEIAREYSMLKQKLALKHPEDIEGYMAGKDPFIKATQRAALAWRSSQ